MIKIKVFADESCLSERCMGYGAIFIKDEYYDELEKHLEFYTQTNGINNREMSYKKCTTSDIDRYIGITKLFFDYLVEKYNQKKEWIADFRSLIINTETNPVKFNNNSWEDGFYKFYFHFLTRSLNLITENRAYEFELNIADKSDSYPYRTEILQTTIGGAIRKNYGDKCILHEIERGNPKQSRIHQMADILLGCVTYRFNNKELENKAKLVEYIESRIGNSLNYDFLPHFRPFNVWGWTSKNQERWVKGATGYVL